MKMIKHIIKNNLRAFHIIRKTIPSLVFMTMFKSIVLAIIEPLMTIWYFRYVLDAVMMQVPIRQILTITLIMCILVVGKQLYSSWYDNSFLQFTIFLSFSDIYLPLKFYNILG